jgi:hypothetical protein
MTKATTATTTPAMKLLTTAGSIETGLKAFFTAGQTLQATSHMLACSVLQHVGKHSDVRLVDTMLAAMPEFSRKTALMIWFAKFGPITFDATTNKASFVKGGKTLLGDAMGTPFWKLTKDVKYEPIVIDKFIAAMIKKLTRDAKETNRDHSAIISKISKVTA